LVVALRRESRLHPALRLPRRPIAVAADDARPGPGQRPFLEERRALRHLPRTLAIWRQRFDAAWPRIEELGFDERFRRLWRYYLSYCEGGFRSGRIDVGQIVLEASPAWP
jgi:hypothetical protein